MKLTYFFATLVAAMGPTASYAQTCSDANGNEVGDSGQLDIMLPDSRTSFIRKGSERCPCAYVSETEYYRL